MARTTRFFRWFRTLPLLLVVASGLLALLVVASPKSLLRRFLYPLDHRDAIIESSASHGVDPALVCAVIKCESDWNTTATSSAGAIGLMQLMPDTAATMIDMGFVSSAYDPSNLTDPATNIEFGCAYLGYLQTLLSTRDQVIAAYNAGIGTVQDWLSGSSTDVSAVIAYPETRLYLMRVNETYTRYQSLYDSELNAR